MIGNVILMVLVDLLGLKKLSKLNLGQSEEDNLDQVETSKRQKKVEIKENEAKPLQNKQKVKEK